MGSGTLAPNARPEAQEGYRAGPPPRAPFVGISLVLAAHLPLLGAYCVQLWLRPHYQFFPAVLGGFVFLVWSYLRDQSEFRAGRLAVRRVLGGAALALLLAATYLRSPWLGLLSSWFTLAAVFYTVGGKKLFRQMLGPLLFLFLILYPPFGLDSELIAWLQTRVAHWGSHLLDVLGVVHVMAGNVVEIPGHRLLVEEACSGIHSLGAVLALALFCSLWARRPWWHTLLLAVLACGWVLAMNACRVVFIAYLQAAWGVNVLDGWAHELVGVVLFALCGGLVVSTDRLLLFLTDVPTWYARTHAPVGGEPAAPTWPVPAPDQNGRQTWLGSPVVLALFVLVGGWQAWEEWLAPTATPAFTLVTPLPVATEVVPQAIGPWERVGDVHLTTRAHGGVYGDFSHVWRYRAGYLTAEVSLDYAYTSWHELTNCYQVSGWTVDDRTLHPGRAPGDPCHVMVHAHKPLAAHGLLLFSLIDAQGEWLSSADPTDLPGLIRKRFLLRKLPHPAYQVQVFVDNVVPLTGEQEQAVLHLFEQARRHLVRELARQGKVVQP